MEKMLLGALLMVAVARGSGCQANAGPTQCPFVNISIKEGSSEMTVPNISSYPNSVLLCKKNHSSSVCQQIANIRAGTLTFFLSAYMSHFSVLKDGLMAVNATQFLTGEYQLRNHLRENCLQRFFLDVLASSSKNIHYGVTAAVIAAASLLGFFAVWWKKRRGRPDYPST